MSKAANIPRGKRNKNQCNSSPTDAYKVFINPNDGLKRIGWSFLAISSIINDPQRMQISIRQNIFFIDFFIDIVVIPPSLF